MEEVFKQSFNYARIKVFKNYSNVITRNLQTEAIDIYGDEEEIDPFQEPVKKFTMSSKVKRLRYDLRLFVKDKRKTNFFYTNNPTAEFINHTHPIGSPAIKFEPIEMINAIPKMQGMDHDYIETTKDRHIKAHYNNPFASMSIYKIERWIKRDGDKITLKLYTSCRTRNVNNLYFSRISNSTSIVFNVRTGNFLIVTYVAGKKSKVKHFHCNSFTALQTSLQVFYNVHQNLDMKSTVYKDFILTFINTDFHLAVKNVLGFDGLGDAHPTDVAVKDFVKRWIPRFAEIKSIKLPNDGIRLLKYYYPTQKFLKKNNGKLVASVLDRFGIKSKITVKLLHQYPNISIKSLVELCWMLGEDYYRHIGNISNDFFSNNAESKENDISAKNMLLDKDSRRFYTILDSEKENIVKIINDSCNESEYRALGVVSILIDHFKMLDRVRDLFPEMKLNARKVETLHLEHSHLAKIEREMKRGYSIEYIFEPQVIQKIENTIETTELIEPPVMYLPKIQDRINYQKLYNDWPVSAVQRVFEPKLLRTSDDYFEEGSYMSHCVAGYIDTERSIIISLRLGKERVTSEFDVKSRNCIQSKYFCNQKPPVHFEKPLKILIDRVKTMPFPISSIDRKRVPLVINGVTVKPEVPIVFPEYEGVPGQIIF